MKSLRRCTFVTCRRGRWAQASLETDAFEVINLADWEHLMAFYGDDSTLSEAHPARRYALIYSPCCLIQCSASTLVAVLFIVPRK